jgi:hypothetical protein
MAGVSDRSRHENPRRSPRLPTSRQLRYLRILAECTSTTFAMPETSRQASREIARLQRITSIAPSERRNERAELAVDRERMQPSTAVHFEEISGYGSSATWTTNRA